MMNLGVVWLGANPMNLGVVWLGANPMNLAWYI